VVAIGTGGTDIDEAAALAHVWGYAVGLDMTRRDLQADAVKAGRPWDMAKGFDASAPIGEIVPASISGHPSTGRIHLTVNGESRQDATLENMIWSVPAIIATLSRLVRIEPGDLIFTGTPEGVGPVSRGDTLIGDIAGVGRVETTIA
jgi:fumarylpyruvate hydrolase